MDVELVIGFSLTFCLALIFLVIGGYQKKIAKPFFYTASGVMFAILAPLFFIMDLTYGFIGFVFLVPAVFAFAFAGQSFFLLYKSSAMDDWERESQGDEV